MCQVLTLFLLSPLEGKEREEIGSHKHKIVLGIREEEGRTFLSPSLPKKAVVFVPVREIECCQKVFEKLDKASGYFGGNEGVCVRVQRIYTTRKIYAKSCFDGKRGLARSLITYSFDHSPHSRFPHAQKWTCQLHAQA